MSTASNAALVQFPAATGGSETETWVGIGTAASGAGVLLYRFALTASLAVSNLIQPQFAIGAIQVTDSGSVGNNLQDQILKLIFQNLAVANIGNAGGLQPSTVAGSLYVSLHTADPGAGGSQTTNEAAYTSYSRVGVARSSAGWTVA